MADDVSVRELRNRTSDVLRRVEAGARLRVTVDRRPVAQIVPLETKPAWVPVERWLALIEEHPADPGLLTELRELQPDTTDDR